MSAARLRNEGLAREVREAQTCRARSPKQGLKVLQPQSADVLEVTLPQYKDGGGHVRDRQVPCTDPGQISHRSAIVTVVIVLPIPTSFKAHASFHLGHENSITLSSSDRALVRLSCYHRTHRCTGCDWLRRGFLPDPYRIQGSYPGDHSIKLAKLFALWD